MNKITYYLIALFLLAFSNMGMAQGLVINEILTSNTHTNKDEDDTYQDWVELYNAGAVSVNLNGYGLTDDATAPFKWTFPNVSMAPGAYLLVWCSDKNRIIPGSPLHTNFKISSGGEAITLTNAGGVTVDMVPATALLSDISFGRLPNGTGPFVIFQEVTPAAVNSNVGFSEALSPPTFSQAGGFSTAAFNLTLSTTVPGATIFYTLDGSEPDPGNLAGTTYQYKNQYEEEPGQPTGPIMTKTYQTLTYSAPINIVDRSSQPNKIASISTTFDFDPAYIPESPIFKGTVVRARVVKAGALSSPIVTNTYFVTAAGSNEFTIPVVSISINEDRFFDYEDGIHVAGVDFDNWRADNPTEDPMYQKAGNFFRRGAENEKIGNFTYFVGGEEKINQTIGYRTRGGSSCEFPSKGMNLYARSELGDGSFSHNFFSDLTDDSFSRLTLRNGGGDFYGSMMRDAMAQRIVKELHCETESYQPTVAFINGEYWGMLDLREKYDDNYFEQNFGSGDVDLLEDEGSEEEGDNLDYLTLVDYMENNSLASDANYTYIQTRIDPENFMDYYISNIFLDNADWPGTNVMFWRTRVPYTPDAPYGLDGRYRWVFHDLDDTFSFASEDTNRNSLEAATAVGGPSWPNPEWSTLFLRRMLENPTFKTQFINRFADLMNTSFLSSRIIETMDAIKDVIAPELPGHIERWDTLESISDLQYFYNLYTDFANQRPEFQRNHIRGKFNIANNIDATLDVSDASHGYIKMNTIDVKDGTPGIVGNPYPWTGVYFSNIPVTLKAVANPGFTFSHWTGASTSTNAEITINSASSFSVTAVFIEDQVAVSEPIYFWMMDGTMPNNLPLETLATTFEAGTTDGMIEYQSCLVGYPFTSASPFWRKASMERRNSPTEINYIPEANANVPFATSDMKGLQIKEPLAAVGLVNTMVFNVGTTGYEDIKFSFAGFNELTNATDLLIDYSVSTGSADWITTGLASSTLPLTPAFSLYDIDFTSIAAANNNANFKIRLRFSGANLDVDNGNRVTFNNIAVHGTEIELGTPENTQQRFVVYPNPFSEIVNVSGIQADAVYKIYTMDGRLVKSGKLAADSQINLSELTSGIYILQIESDGRTESKKLLKR